MVGLLEHRWLVRLGQISYGFYVYHVLIPPLRSFLPVLHGKLGPIDIGVNFAVTFLVASLSYEYFERPITAWGRRRLASRTFAAAPAE